MRGDVAEKSDQNMNFFIVKELRTSRRYWKSDMMVVSTSERAEIFLDEKRGYLYYLYNKIETRRTPYVWLQFLSILCSLLLTLYNPKRLGFFTLFGFQRGVAGSFNFPTFFVKLADRPIQCSICMRIVNDFIMACRTF